MPGVFTQARRLAEVPGMVVDAVRTMQEDPTSEVEVQVMPRIDSASDAAAETARAAAARAAHANDEARAARIKAVQVLQAGGLTTRDVAHVLGVSPQRVSQLAHDRIG